jgi:DNA invertase Pin-like site-specific DNA recombinase
MRMSTDQQDLSVQVQADAIAAYAIAHDLEVVATYLDEAKSGLRIVNRSGMRQLVNDVMSPQRRFSTVLVYDVSRWGRFQNTDASAYYDYHCRLHGVTVVYVAEQFGPGAGPFAGLIKNLKRVMAAEYSRELAVKVRACQEKIVAEGFSAGGCPSIGLVRQAVKRDGGPRMVLAPGERKAIQSDRIKLIHGPQEEVDLVRRIFSTYAHTRMNVADIVRQLNAEGLRTNRGRPFTRGCVDRLLRYEAFIGNYVWGKRQAWDGVTHGAPPEPLRIAGVIDPIIDLATWAAVQAKLRVRRREKRGEARMITELAQALARDPELTSPDFGRHGCAQAQAYYKSFGSVEAAFALAGRTSSAQVAFTSRARSERTRALTREFQVQLAEKLEGAGLIASVNLQNHVIEIEASGRLQVYLAWRRSQTADPAWFVPRRRLTKSDWRLIVRLDDAGEPIDFFLVPEAHRWHFPMLVRQESLVEIAHFGLDSLDLLPNRLATSKNAKNVLKKKK